MLDLYIGRDILFGDLLIPLCKPKSVVIADRALKDLYAEKLAQKLQADLLLIPSGETAKTVETRTLIEQFLLEKRYGRDLVIVALGGGSTTDVVGFVASTYLRGVSLVLVPTTLLGMVDAAIGGKNGINTPYGKNTLGTFYLPKAIVVDFEVLRSLSDQEKRNGLAEIFKLGLVARPDFFQLEFEELVKAAIQQKVAIVQQDPDDRGMRRVLNFGHTIGHALEKVSDYQMPHGLAVALGCVVEARLSFDLGYLSKSDFKRILSLYETFRLPEKYTRSALLEALQFDKKKADGEVRFVLLDKIGQAAPFDGQYCRPVRVDELQTALDWMEATYS